MFLLDDWGFKSKRSNIAWISFDRLGHNACYGSSNLHKNHGDCVVKDAENIQQIWGQVMFHIIDIVSLSWPIIPLSGCWLTLCASLEKFHCQPPAHSCMPKTMLQSCLESTIWPVIVCKLCANYANCALKQQVRLKST